MNVYVEGVMKKPDNNDKTWMSGGWEVDNSYHEARDACVWNNPIWSDTAKWCTTVEDTVSSGMGR